MPRHIRFHATAIAIITGIVLVLYAFIGPGGTKKITIEQKTDRYIHIYSASWGLNCAPFIEQENARLQELRLRPQLLQTLPQDAQPASLEPIPAVTRDNVLSIVGERCNNQISCSFDASSALLKSEPLASCYKHLEVSYRCFEFDRLNTVKVNQSDTLTIDCKAAHAHATS